MTNNTRAALLAEQLTDTDTFASKAAGCRGWYIGAFIGAIPFYFWRVNAN